MHHSFTAQMQQLGALKSLFLTTLLALIFSSMQHGVPGVVHIAIHPQQNWVVLQLSLKHAVDHQTSSLLQPIAIVLVGDAG